MTVPHDPLKLAAYRKRISEIKRANPVRYWLGKKRSEATKRKISQTKKGSIPWNKGKHGYLSEVARKKLSDSHKLFTGPNSKNWKGGKERLPKCINCRTTLSRTDAKRCHDCDSAYKHSLKGPLSRSWKGGVTSIMLIIRHCRETRQWRAKIFARDNFTCTNCGIRGKGNLHADHYPKSFASIFHQYKIKTLEDAVKCKELWDTRNGRTLCEDCHRERHTVSKVELSKAA